MIKWLHALSVLVLLSGVAGCGHGTQRSAATSTAPPGVYSDRAAAAGLQFAWGHGGRSPLNIIETLGHGCAFLDYDNDGLMDVLLVGNQKCGLFRNLGGGRFRDVTAETGLSADGRWLGCAVGDYDNDGYPDLYITGYGKCVLYHNERSPLTPNAGGTFVQSGSQVAARSSPSIGGGGGRTFRDVTAQAGVGARGPYDVVTAAAFADLDGDGKLDLFAGRYIVFTPESLQFCSYHGVRAGCGVKNYDADAPRVYRNQGGGRFADVTKAWGFDSLHGRCLGVAIRAADHPPGVVLYAANDEKPGDLMMPRNGRYINEGVQSGTAYNSDGLVQGGMGVDWGDFNNDGRPDLVVATFQSEPRSIYRDDGGMFYTEVGGSLGIAADTERYIAWTAKFLDYDNDGWLDLLMTHGHTQDNVAQVQPDRTYPQPMMLFHNEQGRLLRRVGPEAGEPFRSSFVGRGAAVGDYDNDGRMDAVVVNEEGPALLLHNECSSGGHWLGVRLEGVHCNRDGIGARVRVDAGGKTYVQDHELAGGYLSAHDARMHFGLGSFAGPVQVQVRWPDGHISSLKPLPVDRYVTVTESGR